MGALFINFLDGHYVNAGVSAQVFHTQKILLGIFFIRRKKELLFETGGKVSASNAVKCQGTRCESGTVAPL
jgi:hypothetical protein